MVSHLNNNNIVAKPLDQDSVLDWITHRVHNMLSSCVCKAVAGFLQGSSDEGVMVETLRLHRPTRWHQPLLICRGMWVSFWCALLEQETNNSLWKWANKRYERARWEAISHFMVFIWVNPGRWRESLCLSWCFWDGISQVLDKKQTGTLLTPGSNDSIVAIRAKGIIS